MDISRKKRNLDKSGATRVTAPSEAETWREKRGEREQNKKNERVDV